MDRESSTSDNFDFPVFFPAEGCFNEPPPRFCWIICQQKFLVSKFWIVILLKRTSENASFVAQNFPRPFCACFADFILRMCSKIQSTLHFPFLMEFHVSANQPLAPKLPAKHQTFQPVSAGGLLGLSDDFFPVTFQRRIKYPRVSQKMFGSNI